MTEISIAIDPGRQGQGRTSVRECVENEVATGVQEGRRIRGGLWERSGAAGGFVTGDGGEGGSTCGEDFLAEDGPLPVISTSCCSFEAGVPQAG